MPYGKGAPVSFPPLFFFNGKKSAKILLGRFDTRRKAYGLRRAAGVCAGGICFGVFSCGRVCRTTLDIISNLIPVMMFLMHVFVCGERKCALGFVYGARMRGSYGGYKRGEREVTRIQGLLLPGWRLHSDVREKKKERGHEEN